MSDDGFSIRFWGVRGSLPLSGPDFQRVGGRTSCVEMRCGGNVLLFDAGTGLQAAGEALMAEGIRDYALFLSHCHYDHVIGLPFFRPLYCKEARVAIHGGQLRGRNAVANMMAKLMRPPFFPVRPEVFVANVSFPHTLSNRIDYAEGLAITTHRLDHPGGSTGYRVDFAGRSVAYVTDVEHRPGTLDEALARFMAGADMVIYDTSFTDAEMPCYVGFGHSTWEQGVRLCAASGAKRLALFHHSHLRTDAELETIEAAAQAQFAGAFLARDDLFVDLKRP